MIQSRIGYLSIHTRQKWARREASFVDWLPAPEWQRVFEREELAELARAAGLQPVYLEPALSWGPGAAKQLAWWGERVHPRLETVALPMLSVLSAADVFIPPRRAASTGFSSRARVRGTTR